MECYVSPKFLYAMNTWYTMVEISIIYVRDVKIFIFMIWCMDFVLKVMMSIAKYIKNFLQTVNNVRMVITYLINCVFHKIQYLIVNLTI